MLLYVAAFIWIVKLKPTRLLFMAFFIKYFANTVVSIVVYLESVFFKVEHTSFGLYYNLILFCLLCVIVPLMFIFIKKVLQPLYKIENNNVWKLLWLAPMLFYILSTVISKQNKVIVSSIEYVIQASILFLISILFYAMILETLRATKEREQAEQNIEKINRQLDAQREYFSTIAKHVDEVRTSSHDLRHHLIAIQGLNNAGNATELNVYINNILSAIPSTNEILICKNLAVNAVSVYYLGIAKKSGIDTDIKINIPEETGIVPAADLCIIIGNLFENAIEACNVMKSDNKFIRIRSKIDGASLTISVTNSFDGLWREKDGKYLSRKGADFTKTESDTQLREGIGISSVHAICDKYEGLANVQIKGNVWVSSAVITFEE